MPPTILVVDDDADVLDLVAELLQMSGYVVLRALSGMEAIEQSRRRSPDLVLLDQFMPQLDGVATAEALQADPATRRIPLVAMTGGQRDVVARLARAGCIGFIPKPIDPHELPRLVDDFLRERVRRGPRQP